MDDKLITLRENIDTRGVLRVLNQIPFMAQRVYFIDKMTSERGGHRHKITRQAMICARGSVEVYMHNGVVERTFELNSPNLALLIEPEDWHQMRNASADALIVVLASETYNPEDYIHEPY